MREADSNQHPILRTLFNKRSIRMSTLASRDAIPPANTFSRKLLRGVVAGALLAVSIWFLAYTTSTESIANRDFIEYWAAGQQLMHGANPYDANQIFALERSVGKHKLAPIIMFNPPSGLFLTLPLGMVRPKAGYLLWSLFVLGAWLGSIHMIWVMNGRPSNRLHSIGYFFAPAIACFLLGQMAAFVLFGLTLFLYLHRRRPMLAGAALVLCALKPHLLLPFGVVLLVWAVSHKSYRLLSGAAIALAISCLVPVIFDPSIYGQYTAMARTSSVKAAFIPTLSELLRFAIKPDDFWLEFLPAVAGCLWAIWYFRRYRNVWDWNTHGLLLVPVSFLVAPYAWFFDAIILLPSLLYAAYRARPSALAVLFGLLAIAGLPLLLFTPTQSAWFVWSSPAWLAWYVWTIRRGPTSPPSQRGLSLDRLFRMRETDSNRLPALLQGK